MTDTEIPAPSLLAIANGWIDGVCPSATRAERADLYVEFRTWLDDDAQAELDRDLDRAIGERSMGGRRYPGAP
jgi:hypothetical protein